LPSDLKCKWRPFLVSYIDTEAVKLVVIFYNYENDEDQISYASDPTPLQSSHTQ
jgi:hypothetical protein